MHLVVSVRVSRSAHSCTASGGPAPSPTIPSVHGASRGFAITASSSYTLRGGKRTTDADWRSAPVFSPLAGEESRLIASRFDAPCHKTKQYMIRVGSDHAHPATKPLARSDIELPGSPSPHVLQLAYGACVQDGDRTMDTSMKGLRSGRVHSPSSPSSAFRIRMGGMRTTTSDSLEARRFSTFTKNCCQKSKMPQKAQPQMSRCH